MIDHKLDPLVLDECPVNPMACVPEVIGLRKKRPLDGFYGGMGGISANVAYSTTSPGEQLRSDSSLSECCLCYTTHGSRHASRSHRPSKTIQGRSKTTADAWGLRSGCETGTSSDGLHFMPVHPASATPRAGHWRLLRSRRARRSGVCRTRWFGLLICIGRLEAKDFAVSSLMEVE